MSAIDVNPERLGQLAEALAGQSSSLHQARGDLSHGVATATNACGPARNGDLDSALQNLRSAWDFDVAAAASDLTGFGSALTGLAEYYGQAEAVALQDLS